MLGSAAISGIILGSQLLMGPLPAHAVTKSQLQELEMKKSISARTGKPLPAAVRQQMDEAPGLTDAPSEGGSVVRSSQLRNQLRSLSDELTKQREETQRLQSTRASNDFQLKQSMAKQQAAEEALAKQSEDAAAAAAEADAALEKASREAAAAAGEAEAAVAKASREAAAAAAQAAAANAAAAEAVAALEEGGGEEAKSGPGALANGLGIFIGGGLGGYVFLQRKGNELRTFHAFVFVWECEREAPSGRCTAHQTATDWAAQQEAQSVLATQVSKEQGVVLQLKEEAAREQALVAQLKQQSGLVKAALVKEQQLVVDVRAEMQSAVDGRTRMLDLERKEKEANKREAELANTALATERKLVKATKEETAAATELMQAERAAKFVAEAEATAIAAQLASTEELMRQERAVARQVGVDALAALAAVRSTEEALGSAIVTGERLRGELQTEGARAGSAETSAAQLQREVAEAGETIREQQEVLVKVGSEALSMRKAMKSLKQQALEISVRSQREADAATEVRRTVEDSLKAISAELQVERDTLASTRTEMSALKGRLVESEARSAELSVALQQARDQNDKLAADVVDVQAQVCVRVSGPAPRVPGGVVASRSRLATASQALAAEQAGTAALRGDVASLQGDLNTSTSDLTAAVAELAAERGTRVEMMESFQELKTNYFAASESLELEQNDTMRLKREALDLNRQIQTVVSERAAIATTAVAAAAAAIAAKAEAAAAKGDADEARLEVARAQAKSDKLGAVLSQAELQVQALRDASIIEAAERRSLLSSLDDFEEASASLRQTVASLEDQRTAEAAAVARRERELVQRLEGASAELAKAKSAALQIAGGLEAEAAAAKGDAESARQEAQRARQEAEAKGAQLVSSVEAAAAAAAAARAEAAAAKGDAETARLGVERAQVEADRLAAVLSQAELQVQALRDASIVEAAERRSLMSSVDGFEEESRTLRDALASAEDRNVAERKMLAGREQELVQRLAGVNDALSQASAVASTSVQEQRAMQAQMESSMLSVRGEVMEARALAARTSDQLREQVEARAAAEASVVSLRCDAAHRRRVWCTAAVHGGTAAGGGSGSDAPASRVPRSQQCVCLWLAVGQDGFAHKHLVCGGFLPHLYGATRTFQLLSHLPKEATSSFQATHSHLCSSSCTPRGCHSKLPLVRPAASPLAAETPGATDRPPTVTDRLALSPANAAPSGKAPSRDPPHPPMSVPPPFVLLPTRSKKLEALNSQPPPQLPPTPVTTSSMEGGADPLAVLQASYQQLKQKQVAKLTAKQAKADKAAAAAEAADGTALPTAPAAASSIDIPAAAASADEAAAAAAMDMPDVTASLDAPDGAASVDEASATASVDEAGVTASMDEAGATASMDGNGSGRVKKQKAPAGVGFGAKKAATSKSSK
ncbi:MAG: hypothetical protein WDW36_002047 [Sanguina aurantia]